MLRIKERTTDAGDSWHLLLDGRTAEQFPRGAQIYTPSDSAADLFVIHDGQVNLYLRSSEGRQLSLRSAETGQLLGHTAIVNDELYDTFAEAVVPTQIYRIPAHEVRSRIEHDPALGLSLLLDIGQHRVAVSARLEEVAFKSVPARLASLLLELARTHGGVHAEQVLPRHSHRQLAEMINAYRETVTKVINQFRDARLLEIDRYTITLVNLRRLEELAQG
ncbi:MAG TPA: Crp/Fnr family transcriptional regulator [Roseiflexaceae bacterium]|nr:Crp/Fnr family transcriptional regulator [Roseiflexaceae bacterium]